jgi:hypothetical protein
MAIPACLATAAELAFQPHEEQFGFSRHFERWWCAQAWESRKAKRCCARKKEGRRVFGELKKKKLRLNANQSVRFFFSTSEKFSQGPALKVQKEC